MAREQNNFENDDVSRLLGSLKSVDAPGDFDFHVRARIASGRPAVTTSLFSFSGRAAVPAMLALIAAGYFGYRSYNGPTADHASLVPSPAAQQQSAVPVQPQAPSVTENVPPPVVETKDTVASAKQPTTETRLAVPNNSEPARPKVRRSDNEGGSADSASRIAPVLNVGTNDPQQAKEALSRIGVEASNSGDDLTVGTVRSNTAAERSGLKPGDVIIGKVNGKTVRVRRDGKVIELKLKP